MLSTQSNEGKYYRRKRTYNYKKNRIQKLLSPCLLSTVFSPFGVWTGASRFSSFTSTPACRFSIERSMLMVQPEVKQPNANDRRSIASNQTRTTNLFATLIQFATEYKKPGEKETKSLLLWVV